MFTLCQDDNRLPHVHKAHPTFHETSMSEEATINAVTSCYTEGAGIAQWLERRTRD